MLFLCVSTAKLIEMDGQYLHRYIVYDPEVHVALFNVQVYLKPGHFPVFRITLFVSLQINLHICFTSCFHTWTNLLFLTVYFPTSDLVQTLAQALAQTHTPRSSKVAAFKEGTMRLTNDHLLHRWCGPSCGTWKC